MTKGTAQVEGKISLDCCKTCDSCMEKNVGRLRINTRI